MIDTKIRCRENSWQRIFIAIYLLGLGLLLPQNWK